jgi:hypothetical protein
MKLREFIRPYGLFGLTHAAKIWLSQALRLVPAEEGSACAKAVRAISRKAETAVLNGGTVS